MGFSKEKVNLQKRHKREYYDTTRENKQICRRRKFTYLFVLSLATEKHRRYRTIQVTRS